MTEFPVSVAVTADEWRATRQGTQPNTALLEMLAGDATAPDGFRITRGELGSWDSTERRIEVDQTNDSWIVGEAIVVKWITEPLVGPHPAPERMRRLDEAGFTATPRLRGMLEWATPEGFWVPVATAVDVVPDATDGWTWCLNECRIGLGVESGPSVPFTRRLGELTAAMHLALADSPTGPVADHGDYHVGQVLRTPTGDLFVIDFDGNPVLSPAQRVQHRPAAYDVAGMLLAMENVGHVVQHYAPTLSDDEVIGWTDRVHGEFLAAYRETADALLDLDLLEPYMLDQIQREIDYAEARFPDWLYVPEAALRRRAAREESS